MYIGLHVKCPLFLSDFNENWILWDRFSKNNQVINFMKISGLRAEFFHAEGEIVGWTDIYDEANSRFSQFREKRLKNRERVWSTVILC